MAPRPIMQATYIPFSGGINDHTYININCSHLVNTTYDILGGIINTVPVECDQYYYRGDIRCQMRGISDEIYMLLLG